MIHRGPSSCAMCGKQLTDATSRMFGIGPDCRRTLTPAQLRRAREEARQKADPLFIPEQRPASPQARRNNAVARAVIERAAAPETARCHHGGIPGACPMCRQEADPHQAAARIIREVQAERRAARDAAYVASMAHRPVVQLALEDA